MFQRINGIGPVLSKELEEKLGIPKTMTEAYDMLLKYSNIVTLPIATIQDITYVPLKIIPREIISFINIDTANLKSTHMICGSYRRECPYSSDIDMVVICNDVKSVLKQLNMEVIDPYASGTDRTSCLIRPNWIQCFMKLDIFIATADNYAYMIFYATGSKVFNIRMRQIAKKIGLKLNQYGLFKDDVLLPAKSEEEIFSLLGLDFISPNMR